MKKIIQLLSVFIAILFISINANAQGEGPKAFWPAPKGTSIITPLYLNLKSNRIFTNPIFVKGAEFDTNVYGIMATTIFSIKGKTAAVAGILTGGSTSGGLKGIYEGSSSGLADFYAMGILNLYGAPSVDLEGYMKTKYNWIIDLQLGVKAPTGKYDKDKLVNLGTNRWQFKVGFPMMKFFNWGTAKVTSIEMLPSVSFFTNNNDLADPNETLEQKPIFNLESHITQRVTKMLWISLDSMLYTGGVTSINDVSNDNSLNSFQLGGTLGADFSAKLGARISFGKVLGNNENTMDGQMIRVMANYTF